MIKKTVTKKAEKEIKTDAQYQSHYLTKVTNDGEDQYTLGIGGAWLGVTSPNFIPKAGMTLTLYWE